MDAEFRAIRFTTRVSAEIMATLFGAQCQCAHVAAAPVLTAVQWIAIDVADNSVEPVPLASIIATVACFHSIGPALQPCHARHTTTASSLRFSGPRPPPLIGSARLVPSDDGRFILSPHCLALLETYTLQLAWPAYFADITATAKRLPEGVSVAAWLADVGSHMESSHIEFATREIFCAAVLPLAVIMRSSKPTNYEHYRDHDARFPQPAFDTDITVLSSHTPVGLLARGDFFSKCAAAAIAAAYISSHSNIRVRINATPVPFCAANTVYFHRDHPAVFRDPLTSQLVQCSHADLPFHLISCVAAALPANTHLAAAVAAFKAPPLIPAFVAWA